MPTTTPEGMDGQLLKKLRKRLGLHQHQVAAQMRDLGNDKEGINQGRISEWENGEPIPPHRQTELRRILSYDKPPERPS